MKVFLLHADRDFEPKPALRDPIYEAIVAGDLYGIRNVKRNLERERQRNPEAEGLPGKEDAGLVQDLELTTLWNAMAAGDEYLFEVAKRVVLSSLRDPAEIRYRQQVLADCLEQREIVRRMYELALEALGNERQVGGLWHGASPDRILSRSVQVLKLHASVLRRLRALADEHAGSFRSAGFQRFFRMLADELSDDYLQAVDDHLRELEFKRGVHASAELGKGNKGRRYLVHRPHGRRWAARLPLGARSASYSFQIPPRDEGGFKALEEIRGRAINLVANAVAQSADHIKSFFAMLRLELAFYLGCVNLHEALGRNAVPTCLPDPLPVTEPVLEARGIYDVCLALHLEEPVVGNDVRADGRPLIVITGANQGGKSTLLRSLGLAQLMLQAGMFVGAESFRAAVSTGLFSHYKREEDATMRGGKLDEELARMSRIADAIEPGAILLCNESFASTNEREGSEIARQVVRALLDREVRVFLVTHMYDLARSLRERYGDRALFLRAERRPDGTRTFKLIEGEPLPTSYGEDSFRRVFGDPLESAAASP